MVFQVPPIEDYYRQKFIAYQIVESCKNRECAMVEYGGSRGAHFSSIEWFWKWLDWINWQTKREKIYRGVAKLKEIPVFTWNSKERSKFTLDWFTNKFKDSVYAYDLFLDFDKDKEDDSLDSVLSDYQKIINIFNKFNLPYYTLFSGNKGFQVIIDGSYMPKPQIINEVVYPHKLIAERIKIIFKLKKLDLANNGVPNRLCKIPYSLVGENIALPLDDNQIKNFKIEDMKYDNVLKNVELYNRGLLQRKGNKEDVDKFIKIIGINLG